MIRRSLAIGTIALSTFGLLPGEGKATIMSPMTEDVIFIGCTLKGPGTGGMTVYSFDAVSGSGKWIATELGNTKSDSDDIMGKKCSQALNKVIGTTKGCPVDKSWQLAAQPLNSMASTITALHLFMLTCA